MLYFLYNEYNHSTLHTHFFNFYLNISKIFEIVDLFKLLIFNFFFTLILLLFIKNYKINIIKIIIGYNSALNFIISLGILQYYLYDIIGYLIPTNNQYITIGTVYSSIYFKYGFFSFEILVDELSIILIILTNFLFLCILNISWDNIKINNKYYCILLLTIQFFLNILFSVSNIIIFFILFETLLIPLYLQIGIWGSRERKIRASYLLFYYTFISSIFFFIALIYLKVFFNSANYFGLLSFLTRLNLMEDTTTQIFLTILWLSFFLSFAVKIPIYPFHIWLPEAHVEAPTEVSVLLAGILLKVGTYAIIKYLIPFFFFKTLYFLPLVCTLTLLGIIYPSFTAMRQVDIKRIIAYASVAHMNLITLGIFSNTIEGLHGSIIQIVAHGLVSSGLFLCVGVLYKRFHTRDLNYYSGLTAVMPKLSVLFFLGILGNISFPGTCNFFGEFLIFLGINKIDLFITILSSLSIILSAVYSLILYNKLFFGNIKDNLYKSIKIKDISFTEFIFIFPFFFFTIFFGIKPNLLMYFYNNNDYSSFNILGFFGQANDIYYNLITKTTTKEFWDDISKFFYKLLR